MNPKFVVERVCRLPADFYGGARSMVELVSDSGIKEHPALLTVPKILAYITEHPELVAQWLRWSEDKRVSSGWFFKRSANGYAIGSYPKGVLLTFVEASLACAEFVVREVDAMMRMSPEPGERANVPG